MDIEKIREIVLDILSQELEKEIVKIASKHGDVPDEEFNTEALQKGMEIEKEHTNSDALAKAIAKDHLFENPDYYDDDIYGENILQMREDVVRPNFGNFKNDEDVVIYDYNGLKFNASKFNGEPVDSNRWGFITEDGLERDNMEKLIKKYNLKPLNMKKYFFENYEKFTGKKLSSNKITYLNEIFQDFVEIIATDASFDLGIYFNKGKFYEIPDKIMDEWRNMNEQ